MDPESGPLEEPHDTDDASAEAQAIRSQQRRPAPRGSRRRTWSASELATLALAHCRFGNAWSQISRLYRTRTDADVKNIFHSALRSKGDSDCILRAYAQAVGPNCDDAELRQAAYEAAKAQYGTAPVLTSAAGLVQPGASSPPPAVGEAAPSPGPGPSADVEQCGSAAPLEATAGADAQRSQPSVMEGVQEDLVEGPSSGGIQRGLEAHSTAQGKRELREPAGAEGPGATDAGAAAELLMVPRRSRRRASRLEDVGSRASTDGYGPAAEAPAGPSLAKAEPQVQISSPAQRNPGNSRPEAESSMLPGPLSTVAEQLHQMTTTSCEAQWLAATQGVQFSRASLPALPLPAQPQPQPLQLQHPAPQPELRLLQPPTSFSSSLLQRTLSAAPQQGRLYGPAAAAAALLQGRPSAPTLAAGSVPSSSGPASLGSGASWQGPYTRLGPHLLPPRLPSSDGMGTAQSAGLYATGSLLGGSWLSGTSGYGLGGATPTAFAAASSGPAPSLDPLEALFRDLEGPGDPFGLVPSTGAAGLAAGSRGWGGGGGGGGYMWSASTMPLIGYGGNGGGETTLAGTLAGPLTAFQVPRMASSPAVLPSRLPSSSWSSPSAPARIADSLLRGSGVARPGFEQAAPSWPSGQGAGAALPGVMDWQPLNPGPSPQGASPVLSGGPSSLQSAAPSSSGTMWRASTQQPGGGGGGSAAALSSGGGTLALEVLGLSQSPFTPPTDQGLASYPPQGHPMQPLMRYQSLQGGYQLAPQAYQQGPLLHAQQQIMTQQRHAYGQQQQGQTHWPPQAQQHVLEQQQQQFGALPSDRQGAIGAQGMWQNPAAAAGLLPGRRSSGGVAAPPLGRDAGGPTA
ncbi:hypothetical protein HYH03_002605 [Edaphochlamys debaryana]|uniref:Myb-like domain-containing protein n=1 Tax=Edaphochlamys debaryana TaxID=47281 RepID=A0A835YL33_9CHLO|nr:hypothetical protein HYH03_002605 [Edaphochlamys debaryana]|eukprot:KAG2499669.1 hypothetical protein HYH03_002605 [Edaphochlamys debaryana]